MWFWNNGTVTEKDVEQQMLAYRDLCAYGGFRILPFGTDIKLEYLTDGYFQVYGKALEKAKELGLMMCLYDKYGFPSGSAGAGHGDGITRFQLLYPNETIIQLNKTEKEVNDSFLYKLEIPEGRLMGVVAMEANSLKCVDITKRVSKGKLK